MGEQPQQEAENHHTRRAEPGELAQTINRRDPQHVQGDGAAEQQVPVIPGVNRLPVAAGILGRLERELQHAHVRAHGGQVDVEGVENAAGRLLEMVDSFAPAE
jgi:hypothetical protein